MRASRLLLGLVLLGTSHAACTDTQYNNISSFYEPNACVPSGYFQAQDLGQLSQQQLVDKCEAQCTQYGTRCQAYVGQLWKAADSNLMTGQCFYYTSVPAGPVQCANHPTIILGEYKDKTNTCFASSAAVASAYCSSILSIGTTTVYSSTKVPKTTVYTTRTKTASTVTQTLCVDNHPRRVAARREILPRKPASRAPAAAATSPAPACLTATPVPISRISSACSCLSLSTKTVTTLTTASTTSTVTKASVTTVTATTTVTQIATPSSKILVSDFSRTGTYIYIPNDDTALAYYNTTQYGWGGATFDRDPSTSMITYNNLTGVLTDSNLLSFSADSSAGTPLSLFAYSSQVSAITPDGSMQYYFFRGNLSGATDTGNGIVYNIRLSTNALENYLDRVQLYLQTAYFCNGIRPGVIF